MKVDSGHKKSISKEQTIFNHIGNKIKTEDREINIIAKLEEPLMVILGNVLSDEECDELIRLSKDKMHRSKIGVTPEVNEIRTSSSMYFQENENDIITKIEKRISSIMNIPIEHGDGIQILKYILVKSIKLILIFLHLQVKQQKTIELAQSSCT